MRKKDSPSGHFVSIKLVCCTLVLVVIPFLYSCAQQTATSLPGIGGDVQGVYRPGSFVWFELLSEDIETSRGFYQEMFGWTITASVSSDEYSFISQNGKRIGGLLGIESEDDEAQESRWICSVSVENIDTASKKAESLGGSVRFGPVDAGERGRVVQITDSQGADLILLRTRNGDPGRSEFLPGSFVWIELFTRDKEASESFYSGLLGYRATKSDGAGDHYYLIKDDKLRGGLTPVKWEDVESNWLPFIGVSSLRAEVVKAMNLGATLLAYNKNAAVLIDPAGAAIGLHLIGGGQK